MHKARKELREIRLEKYARILTNRYGIHLSLIKGNRGSLGCCDTTTQIYIEEDINADAYLNLIYQKAVTLHEMGHMLYTKASAWERNNVSKSIANIIEDGRVEEAISRLFVKARLYFVYMNQQLMKYNLPETAKNMQRLLEFQIMDMMLREAKRTTGIPPLPPKVHKQIIEQIGKTEHDWIIKKTRDAVNAEDEEQSAVIGAEIDRKLRSLLNKNWYDSFHNPSNTSEDSVRSCGSATRKMPSQSDIDKKIIEKIEKMLKKQEKEDGNGNSGNGKSKGDEQGNDKGKNGMGGNGNEEGDEEDIDEDLSSLHAEHERPSGLLGNVEDSIMKDVKSEVANESNALGIGDIIGDFSAYGIGAGGDGTYYKDEKPIGTQSLEGLANKMSHYFRAIAETGHMWTHNQTNGYLEMQRITKIFEGQNQPQIFRKKRDKPDIDLSAVILLDASGSMSGLKLKATQSAYAVTRALELGKYESEVLQFGSQFTNSVRGVKAFNQQTVFAKKYFRPCAGSSTPLAQALEGAEKSLSRRKAKRKVVIVVTDGEPDNPRRTKSQINEMQRKGILVLCIRLIWYKKSESDLFPKGQSKNCFQIEELPTIMQGMVKNVLLKRR